MSRWHLELGERTAKNIASLKAPSCTAEIIARYFVVLKKHFYLAKVGLVKNMHLWNCEKIDFNGDKDDAKVITRRGAKCPLVLTGNNEKINYTVFNCVNADGFLLPPFVVYKSKN